MYWSRNTTVTVDYIQYMYCCSALHDVKTNESTFLFITLTRTYNIRNTNYLLLPRQNFLRKHQLPLVLQVIQVILVVPIFSKVLESVFKLQVSEDLKTKIVFSRYQFGFSGRRRHTQLRQSMSLSRYYMYGHENGLVTSSIFCDLSRAFNFGDWGMLLRKLYHGVLGCEGNFLSLFF